jgi:phage gp37-like protein
MGIKNVEDKIIEQLTAALTVGGQLKVRQVDSLPGDWDADMLRRLLRMAPAAFVAFMGGPVTAAHSARLDAQWAVIVVTGHASGEAARRRGDSQEIGAYEILERIVPKLHGFKIEDEGTLNISEISNLYSGTLDKQGVAVYAARFRLLMAMPADLDLTAIDAFVTFDAKYDLAPFERFLLLPAAVNANASTPDAPANRIVGDFDARVVGAMDDFTPAAEQVLISKFSAGAGITDAYRLALLPAGILRFSYSTDGANVFHRDATAAVPFANFTRHAWRCTVDVDNGAAGHDVKFYTSDDYDPETGLGTWTQLGATVTTAGVIAIFAGSSPLAIGAEADGTLPAGAKLYRAQLFAGINGALAVDMKPDDAEPGDASFTSKATKEVWTINGTASIDHVAEARDTVTLPQS